MRLSVQAKTILVTLGLTCVLLVVMLVSMLTGTTAIEIQSFLGDGSRWADVQKAWTIIVSYRLPRTLLAAIAGGGLAFAGVVFQCVLKNPLADPYVVGIAAGGSLGAVISIALFGDKLLLGTSLSAFVGSMIAACSVYGLARARHRRDYVNTVILAGVIIGSVMNAFMLLILSLSDSHQKQRIIFWLMGDFSIADYQKAALAGLVVAVGFIVIYFNANRLNLLTAGDESAAFLGLDVTRAGTLFMAVAALVTGAVVSVSGTIGFVGLVVPHTMRLLFGPDHRVLLPAALIGGAAFLAGADCTARVAVYPVELPVGVITTLTGGPFFLYLLVKK